MLIFNPLNERTIDQLHLIIRLNECNEESLSLILNVLPYYNEEIYLNLVCQIIRSNKFSERYEITESRIIENIYY